MFRQERMRKYKPVELPLRDVPIEFSEQRGTCPNCLNREGVVIGRLGLRLVFRCERCFCGPPKRLQNLFAAG